MKVFFRKAGWPKHVTPRFRVMLRREANALRGLYGVPIYLCGSALMDCNERPRDWDIRITLPDAEFKRRYGDPERWEHEGAIGKWSDVRWKWSDDCVKQSKRTSAALGILADVQVYPQSHVRCYMGKYRLRLDTRGHS